MKPSAIFVHSHIFIYDQENNAYSEGKLIYETWIRYLNHFKEITVLGRYKNVNEISNYNISSGQNVKHIKLPNLSSIKNRNKRMLETKKIMVDQIQNTDVVIARLPSVHGSLAVKIAREMKKPYVIELVGDVFSSLWFHGKILGKILAPISFMKVKKIIKNAPYVLYVTEDSLQRKYPPGKNVLTASCSNVEIDVSFINSRAQSNTKGKFSIGLIGSYSSKYKGIDNALNVVKRMINDDIDVELRILGSGNADWILERVKKLGIEDAVKLDGSLPAGPNVFNWLKKLDLYIQPSLTEGLPRALIEAMYCQLPCIASNVGGIPELLKESNLHAPKDEMDMFKKVMGMYEDEEYRREQARLNRLKAENYTKDKLDQKRYVFWEEVLEDIGRKK